MALGPRLRGLAARWRATTLSLGLAIPVLGVAGPPPPFKLTRFDEDYSYLSEREPASAAGLEDRLKYLRLGDVGYVSLGGELRERLESFSAPRFGIGAASDSDALQRLFLHADLHLGDRLRAFVQLVRADRFGESRPLGAADVDRNDIQNAFVDWRPDPERHLTVRLGRQEILLDSVQRFVSVREGPNVRQGFYGLRLIWDVPRLRVTAFATRPVEYKAGSFDDRADRSQRFDGLYVAPSVGARQALGLYVFRSERDRASLGGASGGEQRQSFGLHWAGATAPFDHDVEAVYQRGRLGASDVRAWAVGLVGGYTFAGRWSPRAALELDAGSGDHRPGDGRAQTFNPLFPKGAVFNETALTSWANLLLVRVGLGVQPTPRLSLSASISERWRETSGDAVYVHPYAALAGTRDNSERRVGEAFQADATWRVDRHWTLSGELVHQRAGPAIRRAGGRSASFAMFVAQVRF